MSNNNYVNNNRRILNAVASEQHTKWLREGRRRQLKKAKKLAMPMAGVTLNCLSALSVFAK